MIPFAVLCFCGLVFCAYMLYRNHQTCQLYLEMADTIYKLGIEDINNGRKTKSEERYEALNSVAYNKIANSFWLPVEAKYFYKDLWFLEE